MNDENVFFLDFEFNHKLRTLRRDGQVLQLRKKESQALALFCNNYPRPVLYEDFLAEVWEGRYVAPQSIAQVIRSLRVSLGDEDKNIIVTIPKLGYQFTASPLYSELVPDRIVEAVGSERDSPFTIPLAVNLMPVPGYSSRDVYDKPPLEKNYTFAKIKYYTFLLIVSNIIFFILGIASAH